MKELDKGMLVTTFVFLSIFSFLLIVSGFWLFIPLVIFFLSISVGQILQTKFPKKNIIILCVFVGAIPLIPTLVYFVLEDLVWKDLLIGVTLVALVYFARKSLERT